MFSILRGSLICAAVLFATTYAGAADATPEQPKPSSTDKKPEASPDLEITKIGTLKEKPGEAKPGVVAVLTMTAAGRGKGKGNKKAKKNKGLDGATGGDETYFLYAKDDSATRIADLLKRAATCQVTGVLTSDGLGMNVSKVVESEAPAPTDKKTKPK